MNYIDILKDIIDNFYVTTFPRDFTLKSKFVCGRGRVLKDEWLNPDFYNFGGSHMNTDKTFHRKDVVDFLRSYKKLTTGSFQDAMKSDKKVIMEKLNISKGKLDSMVKKGEIDYIRMGRVIRFDEVDVINSLKR